jgi:uncharacterized integral membrane protein
MNYKSWRLWVTGIIAIVILIFLFSNLQAVHISYLVWDFSLPLIALIVILLVVGGLLTWPVRFWFRRMRRRKRESD